MSEDNQENGTANGDVPEIELIIKEEIISIDESDTDSNHVPEPPLPTSQLITPVDNAVSTYDQFIIFQLNTETEPMFNYVITQVKKPPPEDGEPIETYTPPPVDDQNDHKKPPNTVPYTISVDIPTVPDKEEQSNENSPKSKRAAKRKKLAEALEAVVSKKMSINKAACVFQVTKSTLWKEVNKHTDHCRRTIDPELNKEITFRISAGESLASISRALKVTKSSLHRHKVRLAERGELPSNVHLKTPRHPSETVALKKRIKQALHCCRANGMSWRLAAKLYSISPSTISKYMRRFKDQQLAADESTAQLVVNRAEVDSDEELLEEETSRSTEQADLNDFDVDAYCEKRTGTTSEDAEFSISFDFESFEEFVKRELE